MSRGKVVRWNFVRVLFFLGVLSAVTGDAKSQGNIYNVFRLPGVFLRGFEHLADKFERKDYANLQIDLFVDSEVGSRVLQFPRTIICNSRFKYLLNFSESELARKSSTQGLFG